MNWTGSGVRFKAMAVMLDMTHLLVNFFAEISGWAFNERQAHHGHALQFR